MKICLVAQHADAAFTPLALLYLKAWLIERVGLASDDVAILEFDRETPPDAMAAAVLDAQPSVVGVSCYVWNIRALMPMCRTIKDRSRDVAIVAGGPEVGPVAATMLRGHPYVDVVVRSEGERPFGELIERWRRGDRIDEVRGISYRSNDDIVETPDAPILADLNQLPSPHRAALVDATRRIICLETQRGCVFRCNFCFYNKDLSIRNRRFDLDRVKREIGLWLDRDVAAIYLMDPIFNLYADRAKEICRFIAANNRRGIPCHAEVWAEFIDDELARLMRDASFGFIEVGLQSTDDTALATVERRLRMQRFLDGVGFLKKYGLHWELQLIYGLPGDTRDTFRRSLNFANSLDAPQLAVYPLMVLPGTELWRKAEALNLVFDPEPPYRVRSHFSMSEQDIAYGDGVVRALQELGDSRTLRLLGRERGLSYADVIDAWVAWDGVNPGIESTAWRAKQFLVDFCSARDIPAAFYTGFASWEMAG